MFFLFHPPKLNLHDFGRSEDLDRRDLVCHFLGVQIFCLINYASLHIPPIKLRQLDSLIKWDNSAFNTHVTDVNVKIPFSFFFFFFRGFFFFSLFPAFGFFLVWGSKFQTLMTPRLDFSNWWAKDTCKGNPVVVTMENLNFSVVVLKKKYSHHSSNGKGERDLREGKKSSFSSTTACLRPHHQQHAAQMAQNSELFYFLFF